VVQRTDRQHSQGDPVRNRHRGYQEPAACIDRGVRLCCDRGVLGRVEQNRGPPVLRELVDDLMSPGLRARAAGTRVENDSCIDHTPAVAPMKNPPRPRQSRAGGRKLTVQPARGGEMDHQTTRGLDRRGITVLNLLLLIIAVVVAAVLLTRYLRT
jgi:hypothetical protein